MCHNIVGVAALIKLKDCLLKVQYFDRHGEGEGGRAKQYTNEKVGKKLPRAALMHLPKTLSSSETDAFWVSRKSLGTRTFYILTKLN